MNIRTYTPRLWGRELQERRTIPAQQAMQRFFASPADQLYSEMENFFNTALRDVLAPFSSVNEAAGTETEKAFLHPNIDVAATEKEYTLSVELPGVTPDDAVVEVKERSLVISGEKKSDREEKNESGAVVRTERSFGSFRRVMTLPEDADITKISAGCKDGILKISIPRIEEKPEEARRIAVTKE